MKRSTDEIIVLALCALSMMGLSLFTVIRIQLGDFAIALLDICGLLVASALFLYVFIKRDIRIAGPALAIASLAGSVTLVALGEPDDRYLLYPTTLGTFFLMPPNWAMGASVLAVLVTSTFIFSEVDVFTFGKFLTTIGGCFLFAYIFARERNNQRDELVSLSTSDALTGVGNRRAFDTEVEEVLRINERNPLTVSLLLLDLDNFKAVNDELGHDVGDNLLKATAHLIQSRLRTGDHAFRYGGDEFAILAQGEGVLTLATDLCQRIQSHAAEQSLPVSASIGVAELTQEYDAAQWIKASDVALYEAKRRGKNQVSVFAD